MMCRPVMDPEDPTVQTVRNLRALLGLGTACVLFVIVAISLVTPMTEPPMAAQTPEPPSAAENWVAPGA